MVAENILIIKKFKNIRKCSDDIVGLSYMLFFFFTTTATRRKDEEKKFKEELQLILLSFHIVDEKKEGSNMYFTKYNYYSLYNVLALLAVIIIN